MTKQEIILNRLLDKYEGSKHLSRPGTSARRVQLRIVKQDLPEYQYEDPIIRDAYNAVAQQLEDQELVELEWVRELPVLATVALNLNRVMECYALTNRIHPQARADYIASLVSDCLKEVEVPWIVAWRRTVCTAAQNHRRLPAFCKEEDQPLKDLLRAFQEYAALTETVTVWRFSLRCYHDIRYFEQNVRDLFLRIARKYHEELALACRASELSPEDQLAFLGIYVRPECYELAGDCTIHTQQGDLAVGAAAPYGLALPSTLVDTVTGVDLQQIRCVTLIENKVNYDEYLRSEWQPGELVLYYGGFLSPQKRKLFQMVGQATPPSTKVRLWADIDMGGFQMFRQLQGLFPQLEPMRMSGDLVEKYRGQGLVRSEEYLFALRQALESGAYPLFQETIAAILTYGVTIEQEVFLHE
jgi:hypothetical protein